VIKVESGSVNMARFASKKVGAAPFRRCPASPRGTVIESVTSKISNSLFQPRSCRTFKGFVLSGKGWGRVAPASSRCQRLVKNKESKLMVLAGGGGPSLGKGEETDPSQGKMAGQSPCRYKFLVTALWGTTNQGGRHSRTRSRLDMVQGSDS